MTLVEIHGEECSEIMWRKKKENNSREAEKDTQGNDNDKSKVQEG